VISCEVFAANDFTALSLMKSREEHFYRIDHGSKATTALLRINLVDTVYVELKRIAVLPVSSVCS
jgi:hypothetical protein